MPGRRRHRHDALPAGGRSSPQHDLHLVSLYVRFGDELERESDMPDFDGFYDRLRAAKELPTTSQPSIGDFLAVYEPLLEAGHDIVSIHLSAGISGTYDTRAAGQGAARGARARRAHRGPRLGDRVRRARAHGAGRGGAGARRRRRSARSSRTRGPRASAEDLVRRRHARVPAPRRAHRRRAGVARRRAEDQADPLDRVARSRRSSACARRARRSSGWSSTCARGTPTAPTAGSSSTSRRPTQAERLVERGREIFGTEPLFVSEVGPVIGAHVGPGPARRRRDPLLLPAVATPPLPSARAVRVAGRCATSPRPDSSSRPSSWSWRSSSRCTSIYLLRKPIGWVLIAGFLALALAAPVPGPRAADAARPRDHARLPRAARDPDPARAGHRPAHRHAGRRPGPRRARLRRRPPASSSTRTSGCARSTRTTTSPASSRRRRRSCRAASATPPGSSATSGSASSTRSSPLITILVLTAFMLGSGPTLARQPPLADAAATAPSGSTA